MLLTPDEIAQVMAYPDEARHFAWVRLLAERRVTIDMIREAEGLEAEAEEPPLTLTDAVRRRSMRDLEAEYGANLDLTDGSTLWAYRIGRAIFFTILALGVFILVSIIGRVGRWLTPGK